MDAGAEKLAGYFLEWQRIEDEKAKLAERSKDLFKAMKDEGYDTKAARVCFREKKLELESTASDVAEAEEAEAVLDRYRSALTNGLASRAGRARESQSYAEAKGVDTRISVETNKAVHAVRGPVDGSVVVGELTDTQEQPETARKSLGTGDDGDSPSNGAVLLPTPQGAADGTAHRSVVTAGETAPHSPSPANAPRLAADDEAAQANPIVVGNLSNSVAPPPPGETDKAGDVPPPSSPASSFNNPRCQHPDTCSHAHDQGSCDDCFFDWAKRPLEEQRRLWAEAMEAASETEAVA